jgi:predicted PhzF superfamily epimerase YddE/YHI9
MSLPSAPSEAFTPPPGFLEAFGQAMGSRPEELHISAKGGAGAKAMIAVWRTPDAVKALAPTAALKDVAMQIGAGSVLATAPGGAAPYDMVSRFFAPYFGVPEDPVTGSAHCALTPFWAKRLNKKVLKARQASARGGDLICTDDGARTLIQGDCALYLTGEIEV